jgi:hypothetical protein
MDTIRALWRFDGVRWLCAACMAVLLTRLAGAVLSYSPHGVEHWPRAALIVVASGLDVRSHTTALFVLLIVRRVGESVVSYSIDRRMRAVSTAVWGALLACTISAMLTAVWRLGAASVDLPRAGRWPVALVCLRMCVVPLILGTVPLLVMAFAERIIVIGWIHRLLRTGRGVHGGWLRPVVLRRFTKPLPRRLP